MACCALTAGLCDLRRHGTFVCIALLFKNPMHRSSLQNASISSLVLLIFSCSFHPLLQISFNLVHCRGDRGGVLRPLQRPPEVQAPHHAVEVGAAAVQRRGFACMPAVTAGSSIVYIY
jgi:hypothetical protein